MKIGVTFGGYCPLHRGHMELIMQAKKQNDYSFVFVCGYEGEERAFLPLEKRTTLIRNFLEDETCKVLSLSDDELGLDQSMSRSNWRIWTDNLCQKILNYLEKMNLKIYPLKENLELVFYVGEPDYMEHILAVTADYIFPVKVIRVNRNIIPISGTKIREQPIKYWSYIAKPFRPYFSTNILIAGTASEGKTTLCEDLKRYFGLPISYEKGRDICKFKTEPEFTVKDYIYNIYEQRKLNEEMICSDANQGIFVSDTDNLITLMYANGHAGKEGFALKKEDYKILYDLAKSYQPTTNWNVVFLIPPKKKPIVDDGERYMPDSDYKIRQEYYDFLKKLYLDFGYRIYELNGDYWHNFCVVKKYIENLHYSLADAEEHLFLPF